nr:alpha-L-arabinofuranosidase C-terminal domain-containing protein [Candidatus Sigynarchaeota archaeon]
MPVNRNILGHFIEHLGMCIENGIWMYEPTTKELLAEPPLERVRRDLFDAINKLGVPILRWPGGTFSDTYHWKDGVGPRERRPVRKNAAWGGIVNKMLGLKLGPVERNHFGTMEFLALCEKLGAEPYINVNYGTGTAEESAAWVEHVKVGIGKTPHTGKLWGIGNEIYSFSEKGYERSPVSYARGYLLHAKCMKAVDPTAKLVAVGWSGHSKWNRILLDIIKDHVDYLSIHLYFNDMSLLKFLLSTKPLPSTESFYYAELNSAKGFDRIIENTEADIESVYGKDNPGKCLIAFDEWNVWPRWGSIFKADAPHYRLVDGIWAALVLNVFIRHARSVKIANFAQLVNALGMIITYDDRIVLTPQYIVFKMYGDNLLEHFLPIDVDCKETITSIRISKVFASETMPIIDAVATTSADRSMISVFLVNKHFSEPRTVRLARDGGLPLDIIGNVSHVVMTSNDPFAFNSNDNPESITLVTTTIDPRSLDAGLVIPPHTVVALLFKQNGGLR